MQIKVFKAGTMKEAMAAMKAELGDDAVILHSKKYKEGGLLGLGSKEIVEITAAVEETSLPKPAPAKPTLFPNSNLSRYKTDGTAQGVEQAEKNNETISAPKISPRPTLINENLRPSQSDELSARVSANLREDDNLNKEDDFENILKEAEEIQPLEIESQTDAEILNSPEEVLTEETEKKIPPYNEPIEEIFEPEEKISESEKIEETEEKKSEHLATSEEKISEPEKPVESEEKISEPEKTVESEEKVSESEKPAEPVEKVSESEKPVENVEKVSETEKTVEPEKNLASDPFAQAQAQAMMFAQINQMQLTQIMQQAIAQVQAQAQAQVQVAEMAEQMREVRRQRSESVGTTPPPAPAPKIQTPPPPSPEPQQLSTSEQESQDKIKRLEDEISQMKILLAEVLGREGRKTGISLHEALRQQEVDEEILSEMATTAGAGDTLADSKSTVSRVTLSNYLTEHLNFSSGVKLNRHGVRLVALLGTTGVGKTTTLAKIAAKFVLENGVNAALITADTYRISAVDQLKTYSDILGLPLEIVYNPAELNAAIERHKHKELILIDTAGRSQKNEYQMRELEEFLNVNPRIEKHLVISATTKLTDAREIMNKFSVVNPERLILTKIDETGSLGMVVNLLRNQKLALSYITTGQSVPDDIEPATADILTDFILKKVQS